MYLSRGELEMGGAFFQRALGMARRTFKQRFPKVEEAEPSREVDDFLCCLRNVALVQERKKRYEVVVGKI